MTLGRIVHFRDHDDELYTALVVSTGTDPEGHRVCGLQVFYPRERGVVYVANVRHGTARYQWVWPPRVAAEAPQSA